MQNSKKLRLFFLVLVTVTLIFTLTVISTSAEETYVEQWDISATADDSVTATLYNDPDNEGYYTLTISGTGNMKDWTSGSSVPWYTSYRTLIKSATIESGVTNIGGYAFYSCSSLVRVTVPDDLKTIGNNSFYWCTSLTNINLPKSLTSIGKSAFSSCSLLTSIQFPDELTDIGSFAFSSTAVQSVIIPKNVKVVNVGVFSGCNSLVSVTIPSGVTTIDKESFRDCRNLTNVVFSEGLEAIGHWAFNNCISLETIDFPQTLTSIDKEAFINCSKLRALKIPKGIINIGEKAFYGCSSIESIVVDDENSVYQNVDNCLIDTTANTLVLGCNYSTIPNSVDIIGDYAFYNCNLIENITIPEGVTEIGDYAFYCCKALASVTFPKSLISIGNNSFDNCSMLTSVTLFDNTTSIGERAFSSCTALVDITLPSSLLSIGERAFNYCSSLKTIIIPDSVVDITTYYLFYECALLEKVVLPSNITEIGADAFYNCSSLVDLTIPEGVKGIGNQAFYGCSSLKRIIIPENVTSIGNYAFYNCKSLESLNIPKNITKINDYAFYGCNSLANITIPQSVTSIGDYAFDGCAFVSIEIPEGVTVIGRATFSTCHSLISVSLPESLTDIGANAFQNCSSLENIVLPESITKIWSYTFEGCSHLSNIVIPENVTLIGFSSFNDCNSLESITIPKNVTSIEGDAFLGCDQIALVYIDASTIASTITKYNSNGYLSYNAATVATSSDITEIGSYITENYTFVDTFTCLNSNGVVGEYNVYSTHAHSGEEAAWSDGEGFTSVCDTCGLQIVRSVDVSGLVTFDGYSARISGFNGLRSQYTLDLDVLEALEGSYNVEIGMLMKSTANDSEEEYNALTVDNATVKSTFYSTEQQYVGKYYDYNPNDDILEFVYAVTFGSEGAETVENFERGIMYRVYIIVSTENGASVTQYVDNISELFGYSVSMKDLAEMLMNYIDSKHPMLQRVIALCAGDTLLPMDLMEVSLDRYSIVVNDEDDIPVAEALNESFKAASGYELPILINNGDPELSATYSNAYIYINTSAGLESDSGYTIETSAGKAVISADFAEPATVAVKRFVEELVKNNYGVIGTIVYKPDWTKPIK